MDPLTDRAERAARRHPAAALSVSELSRLIQGSGTRVREEILLQTLLAAPGRFRVVDPWKGPWSRLRADRWRERGPGAPDPLPTLGGGPCVVTTPGAPRWKPGSAAPAYLRMRATLVRLGWTVDDVSPTDLVRWHRLVLEGRRLGHLLGGRG